MVNISLMFERGNAVYKVWGVFVFVMVQKREIFYHQFLCFSFRRKN